MGGRTKFISETLSEQQLNPEMDIKKLVLLTFAQLRVWCCDVVESLRLRLSNILVTGSKSRILGLLQSSRDSAHHLARNHSLPKGAKVNLEDLLFYL